MEILGHLLFALAALFLIGLGIVVGLAIMALLAGLTGVGVISTSVVVGFWRRRTLAGVRVFLVQCGVLAGAPVGAALAWVTWQVWPSIDGGWQVLAAGAAGGALGGLAIAWLASAAAAGVTRHVWPWLKARVTVFQTLEA